jgi:multidrug resistance protein, MATE family
MTRRHSSLPPHGDCHTPVIDSTFIPKPGSELRALLALAVPVVIDHVGTMSMGMVDTILVGRVGARELAAVGTGSAVYFALMTLCFGILSAVAATVAHAAGARDDDEVGRTLVQGGWVAVALAAIALTYISFAGDILRLLGQPEEIIPLATRYLGALSWGIPGTLLNALLRSFAVGLGQARVPMLVSIGGSLMNLGLATLLVFGGAGIAPLGVAGAGYATAATYWAMFGASLAFVLRAEHFARYRGQLSFAPDMARLGRLVRLGLPIGVGSSLEAGVFALTTIIMGRIGTTAVAAHQVALNVAATTFMVPMGVSIATATRVGHAAGAGDMVAAARAGWTGIGTGMGFMAITAMAFLLFREQIVALYTRDPAVAALAATLLMIGGAFQLGDGLQVTAQGALRGLKDTTRPMLVNLLAYWLVGFPVGLYLAFELGLDGPGLWWGLTLGLTVAGALHVQRFRKLTASP